MEPFTSPMNVVGFTVWLLMLLLNANEPQDVPELVDTEEESEDPLAVIVHSMNGAVHDAESILRDTLHTYRFCTTFTYLEDDVGF